MSSTAKSLCRPVAFLQPEKTVSEAARLMAKDGIGSILVGSAEKPVGIFTERDMVRRVVACGLDPARTKLGDVATKGFETVEAGAPITQVFKRLAAGNYRHLPIVENGRIVGIASVSDLNNILKGLAAGQEFLEAFADEIAPSS